MARPTRLAAILLLWVWVGPVTFAQTDSWRLLEVVGTPERASAESQVIPAGMAMAIEPNTVLMLHLRNGMVREGRFVRRTLLDSTLYAARFAAHARWSSFLPIALGETVSVSLVDGRQYSGGFLGYGELTLLLRSSDATQDVRIPFESTTEIRRANGDPIEPSDLLQAFRTGLLPSAEALELQEPGPSRGIGKRWGNVFQVAVDDIESVTLELPSGDHVGGTIVLGVLVGVAAAVVLFAVLVRSALNSKPKCSGPGYTPPTLLGVHLTTRPFDRSRGCYVGDPLAVADAWPERATIAWQAGSPVQRGEEETHP